MSFRIAVVETLLFAALICGLFPAATMAQSANGDQHILFSSPDGQITSNAPLPMAQAPEPRDIANLPTSQAAGNQFSVPTPPPLFFQPPPPMLQENPKIHDDFRDPMEVRKAMGQLTPAQIMNVPTAEEIFGLAEKPANSQKEPGPFDGGNTNAFGSFTNSIFGEPAWAKAFPDNTEKNPGFSDTGSSNTTASASGFFGGFFDSSRNDNRFASHDANNSDTFFGSSQPATQQQQQQQSSWDSTLIGGANATPARTPVSSIPGTFATAGVSADSPFAALSPFTPPQVRPMDTLPQLPTLPSLPGQVNSSLQTTPAAPTWGPKPPPWTMPQTPLGTPIVPSR